MSETRELEFGESPHRLIGGQVARYRILRQIGSGGMSEVYEAVRDDIGLHVALKLLAPSLACNPDSRRRFLREAQHLSKLDHPGLVKVIDFGAESESTTFLAMELLAGESLRERLNRQPDGKLPYPEVLRLAVQLASTLAAAHYSRVVHRDLKPENLMLVSDPAVVGQERLKVLDFGIARSFDPGAGAAHDSVLIGTPAYMSPEQFRGDAVNPSSDVYSLGIVLYEAMTGQQPLRGSREPAGEHHKFSARPALSERCPEASPQLSRLLQAMLAERPEQRPSMARVEKELLALSAESPSYRSLANGEWPPVKPRSRTHIAAATLLLGIVGALVWTLRYRTGVAGPTAPPISEMTWVRGGSFLMGSTPEQVASAQKLCLQQSKDCRMDTFEREGPQREVEVSSFYVDDDLVSNSKLVRYLNSLGPKLNIVADKGTKEPRFVMDENVLLVDLDDWRSGIVYTDHRFAAKPQRDAQPAEQVTWNGAVRYCQFVGKRLLTEAQWEYLRTGDRNRAPSSALNVTPSLGEWVHDRHALQYPQCPGVCRDPVNGLSDIIDLVGYRVVRGCEHGAPPVYCRPTARGYKRAAEGSIDVGFRCASPG